MAATYPGTVKTYTDKIDGTSIVAAADINSVQQEIQAVETALGTNPATSLIPASVGTYNAAGVSTSLSARVGNLEAGLTANATDGSRVGYTLLYSGNFTSAPGAFSVAGASYTKFVVVINVTTAAGTPSSVLLSANSATTVKYGYFNYTTGVPTAGGGSTAGSSFPISNGAGPASNDTITAELYNANGTGGKPASWVNNTGFGSGIATAGGTITSAITSITITSAAAYPTAATYAVYGVK